ncbi:MAG: PspC domain-containing protein [Bacillota bacterium]
MKKRIYRSRDDRIIAGICGGLADYFNIDATLIRLAFVFIFIFQGIGLIAYLIAWFIIPEKPEEKIQQEHYYLPAEKKFENNEKGADNFQSANYQSDDIQEGDRQTENDNDEYYQTENRQNDDSHIEKNNISGERNKTLGIILIILGSIFLIDIWIPEFYWQKYWPVFLIAAGLLILYKGVKNNDSR